MNWNEFLSLIRSGEGPSVKFFSSLTSEDQLGPILTAFANTSGGTVVVGFDVNNYHLNGTELDLSWVESLINTYCVPKISLSVKFLEKNEKNIMVIFVHASNQKPYYYKNKCYVLNTDKSKLSVIEKETIEGTPVAQKVQQSLSQPQRVFPKNESLSIETPVVQKEKPVVETKESDSLSILNFEKPDSSLSQKEDIETITKELLDLTSVIVKDEPLDFLNEEPQVSSNTLSETENKVPLTNDSNTLNKRQEDALLYLTKNSYIKNKKYRELFDVSHKTAHLELVDLVDKKLICSQGSGRSTCYVLNVPIRNTNSN